MQGTASKQPQQKRKKKSQRGGSKTSTDLPVEENNEESMNKVHPSRSKTVTYTNKSASDSPDEDVGSGVEGDGVEVLTNQSVNLASRVIEYEDQVILKHTLQDSNHVYRDERVAEEERLLAHSHRDDESAEHLKRLLNEEEVLRRGFVDKNIIDEEFDRARITEENRLIELTTAENNLVHANTTAAEHAHEAQKLKELLEAREADVYDSGYDERRLAEILRVSQGTSRVHEKDAELDPELLISSVAQARTRMIESTMEDETVNAIKYQKIIDGHSNRKRTESQSHTIHRQVENAKLNDSYSKSESFRRHESSQLVKQNTRKNLETVENPAKGKVEYRTARGLFRFHLAEDCTYENVTKVHILADDFDFIHQRKRHLQQDDCVYEKDPGVWQIQYDSDYVNVISSVQDFKTFVDATGQIRHHATADCTIINVSEKHLIPSSASFGDDVKKHISSGDAVYENRNSHRLQLDTSYQNRVIGHDLCGEGVRVQRVNRFSIPLPNNTEFHDHRTHQIPAENSFENVSKGLKIYQDSELAQQGMSWALCDVGDIVQDGKLFSLCEGGAQDDQDRVYFIPETGSQDPNEPKYVMPEGALVNIVRNMRVPQPGPGDVRNVRRHYHHRYEAYTPWKRNRFDISSDSDVVHESDFGGCKDDVSFSLCPNNFDLQDLSIDEEYLNESDEE